MNANRTELLLNDILDGQSIERQWNEWSTLAEAEPALWKRLAEAQRNELALLRTLGGAVATAERTTPMSAVEHRKRDGASTVPSRTRQWLGWAVAAVVVIAAGALQWRETTSRTVNDTGATQVIQHAGWTPEQHFQQYVQDGRELGTVIGEVPQRVLLDARPSTTGIGYDVVYLRQVQERMTVPDLYEVVGQDDTGRARLVGYEPPRGGAM